MPGSAFTCPQCRTTMRSANPIAAGTRIKCPKCATIFTAAADDGEGASPSRSRTFAGPSLPFPGPDRGFLRRNDQVPDRPRRREEVPYAEVANDDDDKPRRRSGERRKQGSSHTGLIIGLVAGGFGLLLTTGLIVAVIAKTSKNADTSLAAGPAAFPLW